jgi:hypothetical protein
MEPLRQYIVDNIAPEPVDLAPNEAITDAVVLFRVADFADGGEYYRYATSNGMTLATAIGMIDLSHKTIHHYYNSILDAEADEDDD